MPVFKVRRLVDAWVISEAAIEAENAQEAADLAHEDEGAHDWQEVATDTFDARKFVTLTDDGYEIESTARGDF